MHCTVHKVPTDLNQSILSALDNKYCTLFHLGNSYSVFSWLQLADPDIHFYFSTHLDKGISLNIWTEHFVENKKNDFVVQMHKIFTG